MSSTVFNTSVDAGVLGLAVFSPREPSLYAPSGPKRYTDNEAQNLNLIYVNPADQIKDAFAGVPGAGFEIGVGPGAGMSQGAQTNDNLLTFRAPWSSGFGEHGFIEFGPIGY